jgi:poly(3-hydroxyalkanoate) synthetase
MRLPLTFPFQMMLTAPLWQDPHGEALSTYMTKMRQVASAPVPGSSARPSLFYHGTTRLWDYRPEKGSCREKQGVVFVPSLVNRAHILDLLPECSMVGAFSEVFPTFLLDWGPPEHFGHDLIAYVEEKMIPSLQIAALQTNGPLHLVGYCMGGLLTMIAACLVPHLVQSLTFLATPWDFNAMASPQERAMIPALMAGCLALKQGQRCLPPALLQSLFLLKDPTSHLGRYTKKDEATDKFLALEDWIQHGQPLTPDVALWAFSACYEQNVFHRDTFVWKGKKMIFSDVVHPSLIVSPLRDTVVPPASARALINTLPHANRLEPDMGHIGMIMGTRAPQEVWHPIMHWMKNSG